MKKKNWILKTLGSSRHTKEEREINDYYATDPIAAKFLLQLEDFENVLEPSCGEGHLSKVFLNAGMKVHSSDIVDRGFGELKSFFEYEEWNGDIITNPPYKYALEFIQHAIRIVTINKKIAMFLKIQFLESKKRKKFFINNPPKIIYVSSSRILCAKNGKFSIMNGSAIAYAWFIWQKGFKSDPIIKWFN